jgi:thiosulfate/3-mercaptopyruvate sulfurtransferase
VPFAGVLNEDKTYKSPDEIKKYLKSKGIENPESQPIIVSCMKGFTACTLDTALKIIGN